MSLLMEALKKAERAKQGKTVPHAEQSGQSGGATETPDSVAASSPWPSLLPEKAAAENVATTGNSDSPLITAPQETPASIPDLAPMAIESRNAAPARVEPTVSALELTLSDPHLGGASASPAPMAATLSPGLFLGDGLPHPNLLPSGEGAMVKGADSNLAASHIATPNKAPSPDIKKIAAAQQKAKAVFSAKQPARSLTLLLSSAVAAVVLGLVGFGIYYWQIMSTSTMILPAGTPQPASAAAPAAPVDAGAPRSQGTPVASVQNPIDKPALATAQAGPPAASTADDSVRTEARSRSEPFKGNPAIRIRQSAAISQLNPTLGKAYQSFLSGDMGTAQQLYQKVLQQEPSNRDALLGMAAIALKHKQSGQAAAYYGKLLELDPADPEALAALIGLQGQTDPTQSESRLKKILMQNPQADTAHFALGNLYAQQSRWTEAQQSYFRAYSSAPGNADYAFNLAVSLDHLNQSKLALDYYQRALAQPGPTNFDKSSVQTRITELLQPAGN